MVSLRVNNVKESSGRAGNITRKMFTQQKGKVGSSPTLSAIIEVLLRYWDFDVSNRISNKKAKGQLRTFPPTVGILWQAVRTDNPMIFKKRNANRKSVDDGQFCSRIPLTWDVCTPNVPASLLMHTAMVTLRKVRPFPQWRQCKKTPVIP